MGFENLAHQFVEILVVVGRSLHFPLMISAFVLGATLRYLIHQTVKRHYWFAREFELRVTLFLHRETPQKTTPHSFYVLTKRLLEKSYYEVFSMREEKRRSRFDTLILGDDRIYLTKFGCAWFVKEILKQIRFLQFNSHLPKLGHITRVIFEKNPAFGRLFGLLPTSATNDFLNILPGLFVIGGIFGTFLGVMNGLPELSGMDLNDPEKTKLIMDNFLADVALSMGASVTGIFLSVIMTLINTTFSPERVYSDMVDRFENALDLLWNYSTNNEVPPNLKAFNENADPLEVLAEATVNQEYERWSKGSGDTDVPPKTA